MDIFTKTVLTPREIIVTCVVSVVFVTAISILLLFSKPIYRKIQSLLLEKSSIYKLNSFLKEFKSKQKFAQNSGNEVVPAGITNPIEWLETQYREHFAKEIQEKNPYIVLYLSMIVVVNAKDLTKSDLMHLISPEKKISTLKANNKLNKIFFEYFKSQNNDLDTEKYNKFLSNFSNFKAKNFRNTKILIKIVNIIKIISMKMNGI
jgi:hypothetical protein